MNKQQSVERLDKFLSHTGIASRKDIKQLLKHNDVTVNGKRVKASGERINPQVDKISINEIPVRKKEFVYYLLNKPKDVISTTDDPAGRTNVTDLIDTTEKIYPIGRLDKDTHGLLILTNNGDLTHKLIHPKYHVPKTYRLLVADKPTDKQLHAFQTGVLLRDGITLPAEVKIIKQMNNQTVLELTIHEGRNRQIRKMCEAVGLDLIDLQRIQFGPIKLGKLEPGKYRELTKNEIEELTEATKKAQF